MPVSQVRVLTAAKRPQAFVVACGVHTKRFTNKYNKVCYVWRLRRTGMFTIVCHIG